MLHVMIVSENMYNKEERMIERRLYETNRIEQTPLD